MILLYELLFTERGKRGWYLMMTGSEACGIFQMLQIILVMRQTRSGESGQNRRENRRGIELGGKMRKREWRRYGGNTNTDKSNQISSITTALCLLQFPFYRIQEGRYGEASRRGGFTSSCEPFLPCRRHRVRWVTWNDFWRCVIFSCFRWCYLPIRCAWVVATCLESLMHDRVVDHLHEMKLTSFCRVVAAVEIHRWSHAWRRVRMRLFLRDFLFQNRSCLTAFLSSELFADIAEVFSCSQHVHNFQ